MLVFMFYLLKLSEQKCTDNLSDKSFAAGVR